MRRSQTGGIELSELLELFPDPGLVDRYEVVPLEQVPEPYRTLLVHPQHMTVTMECFHGQRVALRIVRRTRQADRYTRMILLALEQTGRIVQFGIMRFDFHFCDQAVRDEILRGQTPLGRILIEHNILTQIHPELYLRVTPGQTMMQYFGLSEPTVVYGRVATISCNGDPAVELLEISAPVAVKE